MPYIGNQHNVGDHVNNFKVLDDISSYTATFDGSATSVVSTSAETIRIPEHRFIQGQRVTYNNGGGSNIGGLTSGTAYYVSFDSANTIKLATSLANANSNTVINLSSVGGGTSHTLNAAFDGINTKFKLTFGSGNSARLNNATQINVAINNVIQRPNLDANNFTDGFALADNHKIVFKTAPTSQDIFWGSIISNTIENFDLRDNEVDNFTGNGSATEFNLSTIPANNESVIVTIDGVLQHPSDKNTSRAYTLLSNIIQFTAAPALNAEIQVRHIGFAGASTNDVSGFYGRTGNVTLTANDHITTGDITARNFKATGISTFSGAVSTGAITATTGTFSGNVSIGGTLTYEDVTNIDAVGIITARSTIDAQGSINLADSIIHTGDNTKIRFPSADTITAETAGSERLRITSAGKVGINQTSPYYKLHLNFTDNTTSLSGGGSGNWGGNGIRIENDSTITGAMALIHFRSHSTDWHIGNKKVSASPDKSDFVFIHEGTEEALRISSSGKVGIGTNNPQEELTIMSATPALMLRDSDQPGSYTQVSNANQDMYFSANGASAHANFIFRSGNNGTFLERLRITSDGKVGIGSIIPADMFDVHGNAIFGAQGTSDAQIQLGRRYSGNRNAYLDFVGDDTYYDYGLRIIRKNTGPNAESQISHRGTGDFTINVNEAAPIRFAISGSERLRLTSSGNMGLGINSPVARLHVHNSGTGSGDHAYAYFTTGDTGSDASSGLTIGVNATETAVVNFREAGNLSFGTSNTERLRITNVGRVYIGTSSGRSPASMTPQFQIEGTDVSTSSMSLTRNSANSGAPSFIFNKTRGTAVGADTIVNNGDTLGIIQFVGNDGQNSDNVAAWIVGKVDGAPGVDDMPGRLEFYTTADGSNTTTERMRITSDGNVGIGSQTPSNALSVVSGGNLGISLINDNSFATAGIYFEGARNAGTGIVGDLHFYNRRNTSVVSNLKVNGDGNFTFNQKVGIGTNNPVRPLHILDADCRIRLEDAGFATDVELQNTSGDAVLTTNGASNVRFQTNNTERLRINQDGKVGIGTNNPTTYKLHLQEDSSALARFERTDGGFAKVDIKAGSSSGNSYLTFSDPDASEVGEINYEHGDNSLRINTNSGERLRITSTGDVGINVTAPDAKLEVRDSASTGIIVRCTNTQSTNTNKALRVRNNSDTNTFFVSHKGQGYFADSVGIGTDGPAAKMHIQASGTSGQPGIILEDMSSSSNSPGMQIIGSRGDGNDSQCFSGRIGLIHRRTDAKIDTNKPIGTIIFGGNHTDSSSSNILYPASICARATDSFDSATDMPTALEFYTGDSGISWTQANVTAGTKRLSIASDGRTTFFGTNEQDLIHITTGNSAGNTFANVRGDNEAGIRIRGGGSYDGGTIELAGGLRNTDPGIIKFSTGTGSSVNERMRIDKDGNVTKPNNAMFKVMRTSNQNVSSAGWVTIQFNTDTATGCFDIGNNFNTSTNRFNAPVTGYYQFGLNQRIDGGNASYYRVAFSVDGDLEAGNNYPYGMAIYRDNDGFNYITLTITSLIYLTAGQYVRAEAYAHTDTSWTLQDESLFYGYLVG